MCKQQSTIASWPNRVYLLSADSIEELIQLTRSYSQQCMCPHDKQYRIAIIANSPKDLSLKLNHAYTRLQKPINKKNINIANQIFIGDSKKHQGKTAWMFPGYGAQSANISSDVLATFPSATNWFHNITAHSFNYEQNSDQLSLGRSALSILRSSIALSHTAKHFHIPIDAVVGHSIGEYSALCSTGRADYNNLLNFLSKIWQTLPPPNKGRMLAATRSDIETAIQDLNLPKNAIDIALNNCAEQIIIYGERPTINSIALYLEKKDKNTFLLPDLDYPVHTSHFGVSDTEIIKLSKQLQIISGHIPIYSSTEANLLQKNPQYVIQTITEAWHKPVLFEDTLQKMYCDGIRRFVDIGPTGMLSGFARNIFDKISDVQIISLHNNNRHPATTLQIAVAQLYTSGHLKPVETLLEEQELVEKRELASSSTETIQPFQSHQNKTTHNREKNSILETVNHHIANLLGWDLANSIDSSLGFFELGLDSLAIVELTDRLTKDTKIKDTGIIFTPTTLFNHPSPKSLSEYITKTRDIQTPEPVQPKKDVNSIAIIGVGLRLPGNINDLPSLWDALKNGKDLLTSTPDDRWNVSNPSIPPLGGFLDQNTVRGFDAELFNISPKEARTLDPQHRLLLQTSYEAIEHSGIAPHTLNGSNTGVFVGISSNDYLQRLTPSARLQQGGYIASGNLAAAAAGRIAFYFGLHGPALSLDTACSSSLTSIHTACKSITSGECEMALAGGVNLILSPELSIYLAGANALSPEGRCKTFDSSANGYVRSEGGAMILLKPLEKAISDGNPVLGVIRGSAIGHNGHTSGLTVPNGASQEKTIRKAIEDSGIQKSQISFIEAHGTGTSLGDPIEVNALGEIFQDSHSDEDPLLISSIKTNMGHLEAAAGIAGVLKSLLQLQYGTHSPHLNLQQLNPYIPWKQYPLHVCTTTTPLARKNDGSPLLCGISSFGISGANVHLILQEPPKNQPYHSAQTYHSAHKHYLLPLSANTPDALQRQLDQYSDWIRSTEPTDNQLLDIANTLAAARDHHPCRRGIVTSSIDGFATALKQPHIPNSPSLSAQKILFMFTGQGSQTASMGLQLYQTEDVFRQTINLCDTLLRPKIELLTILKEADNETLRDTSIAQPVLFSVEYALAQLWYSWGVMPHVLLGHSLGEYVAATVAGVFTLEEVLPLITLRGALIQQLPHGDGSMLSINCSSERINSLINLKQIDVSIAAINSPTQTVLSGTTPSIKQVEEICNHHKLNSTQLDIKHAFHSALLEPVFDPFLQHIRSITLKPPTIRLISNLTGNVETELFTQPNYWVRHLRETVLFLDGIQTAASLGVETFLEIGPRPLLTQLGQQCLHKPHLHWITSLSPGEDEKKMLLSAVGMLYESGVNIDWEALYGKHGNTLQLPTYPFESNHYWIEMDPILDNTVTKKNSNQQLIHSTENRSIQEPGPATAVTSNKINSREIVFHTLESILKTILGTNDNENIPSDRSLYQLGLDSMMSLQLQHSVQNHWNIQLPLTLFSDATSLNTVADWVWKQQTEHEEAPIMENEWVEGEL